MPPRQHAGGDGEVAHAACSSASIVSGDRRLWSFLPAAGNRWGSDLNNVGSNGNYWSAELNSGNSNNARNLNFNSGNWNADNNNNRNYGFSVRPVCPFAALPPALRAYDNPNATTSALMSPFRLTRPRLLADLYAAYGLAARHKKNSSSVVRFAARLDENINQLAHELISRSYRPRPATCFIISDPKKREVFAADFADRVVHHLYFAYAAPIFERTFIADSYSCIVGRGTHYGIARLAGHIRSESRNDTRSAFALKLDIRGYFMHIRRQLLADMVVDTLRRMSSHKVCRHLATTWAECVDVDLLSYLSRAIILADPTDGCLRRGKPSDWDGLPESKSLFCSPPGCGLPIGNLTSQLFSNVYLGRFDDFMKREMLCRHYGRYVDDAFVVSSDRDWLRSLIPVVRDWLLANLGLTLHEGKTRIVPTRQGVEFLGAFVKPGRIYVSSESLRRMTRHLIALNEQAARGEASPERLRSALSSYGGVMGHYASFNVRNALFSSLPDVWRDGEFDERSLKWTPFSPQV